MTEKDAVRDVVCYWLEKASESLLLPLMKWRQGASLFQ